MALVNDYEVVVVGLAKMMAPYAARVKVVEMTANAPVQSVADIALYDTFAQPQGAGIDRDAVLKDWSAHKLVVYSWAAEERMLDASRDRGIDAYLPKRLGAEDLVSALEQIHAGTWSDVAETSDDTAVLPGDWPGRGEGLSEREAEVLALIVQGLSNQEVADRAYLSINTVKSYIRSGYRKMGVESRSQAVLWGIDHGFRPDRVRIKRPA